MDKPGKATNPTRGQLNKEKIIFPCLRSRLRVWSFEAGSAVPSRVSPLILHALRLNLAQILLISISIRNRIRVIVRGMDNIGHRCFHVRPVASGSTIEKPNFFTLRRAFDPLSDTPSFLFSFYT